MVECCRGKDVGNGLSRMKNICIAHLHLPSLSSDALGAHAREHFKMSKVIYYIILCIGANDKMTFQRFTDRSHQPFHSFEHKTNS